MKILLSLFAFLGVLQSTLAEGQLFEQQIVMEEHLGLSWESALGHKTVTVPKQGAAFAGQVALFRGDECVPMQLDNIEVYPDGSIRQADVWFRSDLPANSTRTFVLRGLKKRRIPKSGTVTDLSVRENGNIIELRNAHTALRLPLGTWQVPDGMTNRASVATALAKHLALEPGDDRVPGPLLGVQLPSGRWTADSRLTPHELFTYELDLIQPVDPTGPAGMFLGYETQLLAQGPIFVRARVVYRFSDHGRYEMTVTLRSQEPLARIDETYENAGALIIDLGAGFTPAAALCKSLWSVKEGSSVPIVYDEPHKVAFFVGWSYYFKGISPVWAFIGDPQGDLLGLVSTDSDWLPYPYNQALHVFSAPGPTLTIKALLGQGQRHWAFYIGRETDFDGSANAFIRWWHRSVALPLDKVANWRLVWPGMEELEFPHTFFSSDELVEIRARLHDEPVLKDFIKRLKPRSFTQAAAALLYSGDPADLKFLAGLGKRSRYVDGLPAAFLDKAGYWDNGSLNCMQITDELLQRYVGLELLLGSDALTPEERKDLLTRLAFMQYVMDDLMFWPPNYDYSPQKKEPYPVYVQGTPNQKICYITARGIVACMLSNHPDFQKWMDRVLEEYERVASGSVAPSGAHVESPFYSSRDTMRFGPFWLALTRAGVTGPTVEPWLKRLKHCYEYLSDMLTPPEPRMGGRRVYHPIGRSSSGIIDPTMMIAVEPFGRGDPEFGRRMRWCWEQQGQPAPDRMGTTGGRDLSLTLLATSRMLQFEPSERPPLTSRRWKGMGAIFRSRVGTDYESNVIFRHDPFCWNLYEANNGAVYFYGKGAPLLPRFGGYWMGQRGQPNLMSIPFGNRLIFAEGDTKEQWCNALGTMTEYAGLGDLADFATGVTRDGHWRRSVLFAKDLDQEDPVYLLVRDDVSRPGSATALHWWIMSKQVQPDGLDKPGVVKTKGNDEQWLANLGKNWKEAPKLKGQLHHFEGQCGVNLDLFIAMPAKPVIVTDAVGVGPGMSYCVNLKLYEYQQLVRIEQTAGKSYLTLLFPRWPGSTSPEYRTIAGGSGVAVKNGEREDRLFLSGKKLTYTDTLVTFEGRAGFARKGGAAPLRLMVVDGRISAGGITLECVGQAAALFDGKTVTVRCAGDVRDVDVDLSPDLQGVRVRFRREGQRDGVRPLASAKPPAEPG